jgi:hypothetical protein
MLTYFYQVRPGKINTELIYSIRTVAANGPPGEIVIAGFLPLGIDPNKVTHIPVQQHDPNANRKYKFVNAFNVLREGIANLDGPLVMMNDDFYINQIIPGIPTVNLGLIGEHAMRYERVHPRSSYTAKLKSFVKKYGPNSYSYEHHGPMLVEADRLRDVVEEISKEKEPGSVMWRSVYGNTYYTSPGRTIKDAKVYDRNAGVPKNQLYLSSVDNAWFRSGLKDYLRSRYSQQSPYEIQLDTASRPC